MFKFTQHVSKK